MHDDTPIVGSLVDVFDENAGIIDEGIVMATMTLPGPWKSLPAGVVLVQVALSDGRVGIYRSEDVAPADPEVDSDGGTVVYS